MLCRMWYDVWWRDHLQTVWRAHLQPVCCHQWNLQLQRRRTYHSISIMPSATSVLLIEFESSIIRAFLSITDTPYHATTNVGYRIALPLLTYSLVRSLGKAFCELSLRLQMRSRAISISVYFILLNGIFSNKIFLRCKILLVYFNRHSTTLVFLVYCGKTTVKLQIVVILTISFFCRAGKWPI